MKNVKLSRRINMLKSFWAISHVNVEVKPMSQRSDRPRFQHIQYAYLISLVRAKCLVYLTVFELLVYGGEGQI
jgi:hypothetical protein